MAASPQSSPAAATAPPAVEATPQKALVAGRNSVRTTAGIIIADVVGAGILGMPVAVAQFGWLLGAAVMAAMLAANVHISILLWRVRMRCPGVHTYVDLAYAAFTGAPAWQRRLAAGLTGASQMCFIFGMLGLYLLSVARGLGMAFYELHVCLPKWALLVCALLLPAACTAREMGTYKSLVWINVVTLLGTVLIPLGYMLAAGTEEIRPEGSRAYAFSELTGSGVLNGLSTFTFGMTSQFMLTEIISEMRDPAELPKAYAKMSAPFQLGAFLVAGLGGYCLVGDKVTGMIDENIPFGWSFRVAALCLVTHMLISYLIKGVVFCRVIQKAIDSEYAGSDDTRWRSWASWNAIALVVMLAAYVLANVVPFFGDAVNLLGASLTPLSCWVLPIAFFARWYKDAGKDRPHITKAEWFLVFCELALAFVLMVFGTVTAVDTIVTNWSTYGYPFECHCEGLWATCECSAAHVGMGDCLLSEGL